MPPPARRGGRYHAGHLGDAWLDSGARQDRECPTGLVGEAGGRPGVGGLDPVFAVAPVAHQVEPATVTRQRDVSGLGFEEDPRLVLGAERLEWSAPLAQALLDR